jgi:hypothetical protein
LDSDSDQDEHFASSEGLSTDNSASSKADDEDFTSSDSSEKSHVSISDGEELPK